MALWTVWTTKRNVGAGNYQWWIYGVCGVFNCGQVGEHIVDIITFLFLLKLFFIE